MNIKKSFVLLIVAITTSFGALADNHAASEQRPVELWVCSFNEGKSMSDVDTWYADFNKFANSMKNNKFNSFMWVPYFVSDLDRADVVLTFSFPSLTSMGKTMDEFFGSNGGSALFETFQEILDCSGREVWMVSQKRNTN